jgi:hypothetical protein
MPDRGGSKELRGQTIKYRDGKLVQADLRSVTAAAQGALRESPRICAFLLINALGKDAYAIWDGTWAVACAKQNGERGRHLVDFLAWVGLWLSGAIGNCKDFDHPQRTHARRRYNRSKEAK